MIEIEKYKLSEQIHSITQDHSSIYTHNDTTIYKTLNRYISLFKLKIPKRILTLTQTMKKNSVKFIFKKIQKKKELVLSALYKDHKIFWA